MVEAQDHRMFGRLTLGEDVLGRAKGIVHAHVKPGPSGLVVGGHVLHARPAAGVGPAFLVRLAPEVGQLNARRHRHKHSAALAQVLDRDLREHDVPEAPLRAIVGDLQVPRHGIIALLRGKSRFDANPLETLVHGRSERELVLSRGIIARYIRPVASRRRRQSSSSSFVFVSRTVAENSGSGSLASSSWLAAVSVRLSTRKPCRCSLQDQVQIACLHHDPAGRLGGHGTGDEKPPSKAGQGQGREA